MKNALFGALVASTLSIPVASAAPALETVRIQAGDVTIVAPKTPIDGAYALPDGYTIQSEFVQLLGIHPEYKDKQLVRQTDYVLQCGWDLDKNHQPELTGDYRLTKDVEVGPNKLLTAQIWRRGDNVVVEHGNEKAVFSVTVLSTSTGNAVSRMCTGDGTSFNHCQARLTQPLQMDVQMAHVGDTQQRGRCDHLWNDVLTTDGISMRAQAARGGYSEPARVAFRRQLDREIATLTNSR